MSRIVPFWEQEAPEDPLKSTPVEDLEQEQLPEECPVCKSTDGGGLLVTPENAVISCPKCGTLIALLFLLTSTLTAQTYQFGTSSDNGVFYTVYPAYTTAFEYDSTTHTLYTLPTQGKRIKLENINESDIMFKDEDYFVYELRNRTYYLFTSKYLTLCRYF